MNLQSPEQNQSPKIWSESITKNLVRMNHQKFGPNETPKNWSEWMTKNLVRWLKFW